MKLLYLGLIVQTLVYNAAGESGKARGIDQPVDCRLVDSKGAQIPDSIDQEKCKDWFAPKYPGSGVLSATCDEADGKCKVTCMEGWEALDTHCKFTNQTGAVQLNICKDFETATPLGCHCYTSLLNGDVCQPCPADHPLNVQACSFAFNDQAKEEKTASISRMLCKDTDIADQSAAPFECKAT